MKIFAFIGLVVSIIIAIALVLIIHLVLCEYSRFYRALLDWLLMPAMILYQVPKMDEKQLQNLLSTTEKGQLSKTIRFKILQSLVKRRIKFLNGKPEA